MATASVEDRQLVKAMSWWDGFMVALANPGFLFASLGGSIGVLGTWGAMVIWLISVLLGALQNNIYAELATMFPQKAGGIAVFAHEAWRRYLSLIGPLATFGYWFAWSTVLSISGLVVGTLVQAQFFSGSTWQGSAAGFSMNLPILIGCLVILFVWLVNSRGIRETVGLTYLTGIALLIPSFVLMFGPYITGDFHGANMHWSVGAAGGFGAVMVWLYIMGWSSYGFESVAVFAPEYRDPVSAAPKALRASAAFSILVYALLPLGVGGTLGAKTIGADATAIAFYKTAFDAVGGPAFGVFLVVCLCLGLMLTMSTATLDGSRALYGIAQDDMTIKWLGRLNKHNVPNNGMTVDAVLNILLITFFGSTLSILSAGNLGYIMAHVFALSGFLLLRRDRPNWPRPIKLSRIWVPIAAFLTLANFMFVVCGAFIFANSSSGYGLSRTFIGLGVLAISMLLFLYRRLVQDRNPLTFREATPAIPETEEERVALATMDVAQA